MIYFLIVLCVTPILWFVGKSGFLINGVDTNFPLDPLIWITRRFFVWNNTINAGSDFSSSTAGLFFHSIQAVPHFLGFSLQTTQIISLVFWFSLIIFSALIFIKNKTKSRIAQTIFVVFYAFNTYMFNSWENVKVANLSLVAAIPLSFWIFDKLYSKTISVRRSLLYIGGIGLVVSGTGINPAYYICWLLALLVYSCSKASLREKNILNILRADTTILLAVVSVNLFWMLPTANYITQDVAKTASLSSIGFTNWVDSLSENTSLVNVLRLQGAWDWYAVDDASGLPLYIPYANNYFNRLPFVGFSYLIPTLAFASFLLIKKKNRSLYLGSFLMLLVAVFLGAGTHPPTGGLFRWMISHIPFFSLFRSPWYIFTPLLTFSYALLLSLLLDNFKARKGVIVLGFVVLIVGNFFYNYPLITGKIYRTQRYDSFFVKFPDYVFEAKDWLKSNDGLKIVGYPDEDIEQFSWGYRGVESVLNLFASNEIFFRPINTPDSPIAKLINQFYKSLKRGEVDSASQILKRINVTTLFEKTDQPTLAPKLTEGFSDEKHSFGAWSFYNIDSPAEPVSIYTNYARVDSSNSIVVSPFLTNSLMVNMNDSVVKNIGEINEMSSNVSVARNLQIEEYEEHKRDNQLLTSLENNINIAEFAVAISKSGEYQPLIENYDLDAFNLNIDNLSVSIDGNSVIWRGKIDGDYISFGKVFFEKGKHTIAIPIQNTNLLSKDNESQNSIVDFDFNCNYVGEVENSSQEDREIVFRQFNAKTAVKTQVKNAAPKSRSYFFYEPVVTPSTLTVTFPTDDVNVQVRKLFCNSLALLQDNSSSTNSAEVTIDRQTPVKTTGSVKSNSKPHTLVFDQNYSKNWELKLYDSNNKLINLESKHFTGDYYKNAWFINDPPESYRFEIEYKSQKLFNLGMLISVTTLLGSVLVFIFENKKKKTRH